MIQMQVAYKTGKGVEALDLYTLNGPALVVDLPHDQNITGDSANNDLPLPPGQDSADVRSSP